MHLSPDAGTGDAGAAPIADVSRHREGVEISAGVHWIGALDPTLRTLDIILRTANGTTYNAYACLLYTSDAADDRT